MRLTRLVLLTIIIGGSLLIWRIRPKPLPPYYPLQCFTLNGVPQGCWRITECSDSYGRSWLPRADNMCYMEDAR